MTAMSDELVALKYQIDQALNAALPSSSDIAQPIVDAMRHSVLGGGKRMRPMLACATAQAFNVARERAYPVACAVEFIHAYSLIHDDLPAMDDDDLRHGLPSAHIKYGEANAILAGDSLHSLAFQTIADSNSVSAETKLQMIQLLSTAAGWAGMAGGQCLDIEAEGKELSLSELQQLHAAKTGALFRVSIQLGVLAAEEASPSNEQYLLFTEFGDRLGLAFQVMDDVLDVTASTEELGKPAGSDEAADKNTFPKLMGLEQARSMANTLIEEALALLKRTHLETYLLEELAQLVVSRKH